MYINKEELVENLQSGKLAKRQNDEWVGGPIPFGYDTEKNNLIEDRNESEILREIFEKAQKEMVKDVYNYIVKKGYKTRDGRLISRSSIYRMFEPQRIHIYLGEKYKTPLLKIDDVPTSYRKKYIKWLNQGERE